MTDLIALGIIAFLTSTLTAVIGIGGGSLLIASMPGFLPNAAIIPVHAIVQLFSNLNRALFAYKNVCWNYVIGFFAGSVLGGMSSGPIVAKIDFNYIPLLIAVYILYTTWGPKLNVTDRFRGEFVILGFLQTGLSMFVGATGPLGQSLLLRKGLDLHALIVTTALFMAISHTAKIIVFGFLGFAFDQHWALILCMIAGTILGSFFGTRARCHMPDWNYQFALKILFTALALRMILITLH